MRHRFAGKRLGRTSSHRIAMRRNMAASLFEHGAIRTTEVKAKELRRFVERLITTARAGTLHARRRVIAALGRDRDLFDDKGEILEKTLVQRLFDEIAPRYQDRPGGYTRIIRLAERRIGDAGSQVILQLLEAAPAAAAQPQGASRRRRRAAKRHEAAEAAAPETPAEPAEPAAPAETPPPEADVQDQAGQAPGEEESQSKTD